MQAVKDNSTAEVNSAALGAKRQDTNLIKNVTSIDHGPAIEMPCPFFFFFFFSPIDRTLYKQFYCLHLFLNLV